MVPWASFLKAQSFPFGWPWSALLPAETICSFLGINTGPNMKNQPPAICCLTCLICGIRGLFSRKWQEREAAACPSRIIKVILPGDQRGNRSQVPLPNLEMETRDGQAKGFRPHTSGVWSVHTAHSGSAEPPQREAAAAAPGAQLGETRQACCRQQSPGAQGWAVWPAPHFHPLALPGT